MARVLVDKRMFGGRKYTLILAGLTYREAINLAQAYRRREKERKTAHGTSGRRVNLFRVGKVDKGWGIYEYGRL